MWLIGSLYKWHARPGSNTKYLEQLILRKTLNMVIRFLLNSLSRKVSLFSGPGPASGSRPGSGPASGFESGAVAVQTRLMQISMWKKGYPGNEI